MRMSEKPAGHIATPFMAWSIGYQHRKGVLTSFSLAAEARRIKPVETGWLFNYDLVHALKSVAICRFAEDFSDILFYQTFATASLVPQTLDRVEVRGLSRGEYAEAEADTDRDTERENDHPRLDLGWQRREQRHYQIADPYRQKDAYQSSQQRQGHCLGQEL